MPVLVQVWQRNVKCKSSESSVSSCGHPGLLNNPCGHQTIDSLICSVFVSAFNSRFSHDVTTAMLVPLNKEKAAMLVPRPNPPGI